MFKDLRRKGNYIKKDLEPHGGAVMSIEVYAIVLSYWYIYSNYLPCLVITVRQSSSVN